VSDDYEARSAIPEVATRWQPALIERVEPRTRRVTGVFLRTALARHEAGQHIDVRLTAPDGYAAQRSYSIASAPGAELIELAIEALDEGEVSPYFHDIARVGDSIEVRGPIGGHFVWRGEDGGPLLLVGGGSGIVPLMAMVRQRATVAPDTAMLLVYSARTWEELIFRDELLAGEARDPMFTFIVATTRGPRHRPGDGERRLDAAALQALLARWTLNPRHVYVCGSNAFAEAVTSALVQDGLPADRIRVERYGGSA
jgi:ferredoxin-NADP reductase